jgi:hypothetical protein
MRKCKNKNAVLKWVVVLLISLFSWNTILLAQSPEKFSYQAIIRNAANNIISNHAIGIRISILQGSAAGASVYTETHSGTTDANGLLTLEVGAGTPVLETFPAINWSGGPYYLKTEIDPLGGTTYSMTGTSQFLSVPYALYAKTADYNNLSNKPVLDGSETKITAGPDAVITGTGTIGTPYQADIKTRSVTEAQRNAIASPFAGQVVWCNNCGPAGEMQVFNGTIWTNVTGGTSSPLWPPAIGTPYQGGVIAYILLAGDPGYIAGQTHGLIASIADISTGASWGCFGVNIATQIFIGQGATNTANILAGCPTAGIAARLCDSYVSGIYDDWYLPSRNELDKLYTNRVAIGGFTTNYYWSSSQNNASAGFCRYFFDGTTLAVAKNISVNMYVRAIRAF